MVLALMAGLAQADDTESIPEDYFQVAHPDPTTATLQSTLVGFGAGHFYAGQKETGMLFLVAEGVGAAMIVAGRDPFGAVQADAEPLLLTSGLVIHGLFRLAEIATAPYAAHATRNRAASPPSPWNP